VFDRDQALRALEALAATLAARGIEGRIFVVGGAAMALAFDARRSTRDIDAVFEPKTEVYRAAHAVAEELDLPDDWLNDAVKGFVPGTDPDAVPVFERPGLSVSAASARFLLAMKLRAARVEQDAEDIRFLAGLLGLHDADAVLQVALDRYSADDLPPRARFLVDELFPPGDAPRR
jgi:methylmalonyl-CoA mutase cobalamin-binding subunit